MRSSAKRAPFMDFEFETGGVTLYPRPETELLVEKAEELLPEGPGNILDIGTGCGNIAISLTKYIPSSKIVALDVSVEALRIARENARAEGVAGKIEFINSDLFEGIRKKRYCNFFDLIISNPPYISLDDFSSLPPEVKNDPYIALYGGRDGLDFYRKITEGAVLFLKKRGMLLMEIGYAQARAVKEILKGSGSFREMEIYRDYAGIERIVKASLR